MDASITVVVTTHNRARLLAEAIESVLASPLIPSLASVVVIDDASTDDTAAVAQRYGVRYQLIRAGSPSGARNAGLALAEGEYVAFLDDDDRWLPGNMVPHLASLRAEPRAAYAYGQVQPISAALEPCGPPFPPAPLRSGHAVRSILECAPQIGAVLFRREMIVAEGGFDPHLLWVEDGDLLVRLAAKYPIVGVECVGVAFRQRPPGLLEAQRRVETDRFYRLRLKKWLTTDIRLPLAAVIKADIAYRGRTSYYLCQDAVAAAEQGRTDDALRHLGHALRISPVHTLVRQPAFWRVLGTAAVAVVPGRRCQGRVGAQPGG